MVPSSKLLKTQLVNTNKHRDPDHSVLCSRWPPETHINMMWWVLTWYNFASLWSIYKHGCAQVWWHPSLMFPVFFFPSSQLCPATCTLLNLSCRWSSKLSWRRILTLSEYVRHQHRCQRKSCESHLLLTLKEQTLHVGQVAWHIMWPSTCFRFQLVSIQSVWGCD